MERSGLVPLSVFVLFAAFPAWGQLPKAQAEGRDCSNLVVNRSFSQTFGGFLNVPMYFASIGVPAPPAIGLVPNAGAGFITFLPEGKVSGQVTLAIGLLGLLPDLTFEPTSQYSLSWDTNKTPPACSGTITLNAPGEAPFHFRLLVSRNGQQIEMIHTDTGLIVGVTGYPVRTSGCSNQTIGGKYSSNAEGWGLAAPPFSFPPDQVLAGYFPFAFSGAMEFRPNVPPAGLPDAPAGSGSVVGWDTPSVNGIILPRTETGWYKVDPDCTGKLVLGDSLGNDFHLEMFIGKSGKALHLVNIDTATLPGLPAPVPAFILGTTLDRMDGNGGDR